MPRTPGTTDGFETNFDVSIVEAKTLKILRTKQLGIGIAATSTNPTQHKAGLAIYRVPELVQAQDYDYATRNDVPDTPANTDREVLLNKKRVIKYELETFDLAVLEMAGSMEAEYASGISTVILAETDAEFINAGMEAAIALGESTDEGATGGFIVNADYFGRTEAQLNTMFFDTVDLVGHLEGTVDREQIGVDKDEVVSITNTRGKARFIKSGQGGDKNETQRQNGEISEINGIALRVHPFIGKVISAAQSFSKDKAYDFSALANLILHTEAVAMPFALNSVIPTTGENSGNPKVIAKYRYGVGVVRPGLVRAILTVAPTVEAIKAAKAAQPNAAKVAELNEKAKAGKKVSAKNEPQADKEVDEKETTIKAKKAKK